MADHNEITQALADPEFRAAWDAVMTGTELAMLTQGQRDAVQRARDVTGTRAPGLPMPLGLDPTRPVAHDEGGDVA